jgi:hypothetical protein
LHFSDLFEFLMTVSICGQNAGHDRLYLGVKTTDRLVVAVGEIETIAELQNINYVKF